MLILPPGIEKPHGGYFIEHVKEHEGAPVRLEFHKNTMLKTGAEYSLRTLFRGEAVLPAAFYIGLTSAAYAWSSTLATLAGGEPVGNGYARIALTRNTVDWTVQEVNGVEQALSKIVTFTCVGANWTQNWQRMFLTDQAAGTAGYVFAVSGPAPAARVVSPGAAPSVQYTFYMRG